MKRLIKKSSHDINNRDKAIIVINGEIYEGRAHAECINDYYEDHDLDDHYLSSAFDRPSYDKIKRFVDQVVFAHLVESEKAIYLETWSLENISMQEAASMLKTKYSDYSIYNDDMQVEEYDEATDDYVDKYKLIMAKRLIRKAEVNYSDFLYDLIMNNEYTPQTVDEAIADNSDCVYNGEVYRVFFFDNEIVEEKAEELADSVNDVDDLTEAVIESLIEVNGAYHSFAKSMNGIDAVISSEFSPGQLKVVIKYDVQNGLNIDKLYNKQLSNLDSETKSIYVDFQNEEEVLALFSGEYEIVDSEDVLYHVYELINGDPTEDF